MSIINMSTNKANQSIINQQETNKNNFKLLALKNIYIPEGVSYAIVDNDDYDYVNQFNWNVTPNGYVVRSGLNNRILLHRDIMQQHQQFDNNLSVDHKNCNKLDNRKENLRICTTQENSCNKLLLNNNTSGLKGVSKKKSGNNIYWKATIKINYKSIEKFFPYTTIGLFQAAAWYDFQANKYHEEFAKTNSEIYNIPELATIDFYKYSTTLKGITKYYKPRVNSDNTTSIKADVYWHACLINDNQTVINQMFPYTEDGLKQAINLVNQKLIELYGINTELNAYNLQQIQQDNENKINTIIQKLSNKYDLIYDDNNNIIQIKFKQNEIKQNKTLQNEINKSETVQNNIIPSNTVQDEIIQHEINQDNENIIDINNIELPSLTTHSQAQSSYYGVHYSKAIRQHPDSTDYIVENWQAILTKDNQVIFRKLFPYTETGKILAAEAINEKLIEFYGPNTRLNIIDKTNFNEEEAKQIQSLKTTSPYRGVAQYVRKYKTKSGAVSQKTVWAATVTMNKRKGEKAKVYTKHFPFTPQGEREAALWYNEKAKECFGDNAILNEIKNIDDINELENKDVYINQQPDIYNNMGVDELRCISHIRKPRKSLADGTSVFKDYWYANIRSKGKKVLSKYFEYNDEGKKAAIDLVNEKLIELYGPDTKLNKYE